MVLRNSFKRKLIGKILVEREKITPEQLQQALQEQENSGGKLGEIMLRLGMLKEEDLLEAVAFQKGVEYISLSGVEPGPELKKLIPKEILRRFKAVPVEKTGKGLVVAMSDPANVIAIEEIEKIAKAKVSPVLASRPEIEKLIEKIFGGFSGLSDLTETVDVEIETVDDEDIPEIGDGEYGADDTPIIKYVNSIIAEAVKNDSTDIHLEPMEEDVLLRLRIDGELREFPGPARKAYSAIVSRIKILSNLDIAERRLPQDGKVRISVAGNKVNLRVSTIPSLYGEKIVMRILQQSGLSLDLKKLGFTERGLKFYTEALNAPLGMILVTGPTGSGKTTTLYSGLSVINVPEKNITTIEDPVEYQLYRVNQVQVKTAINLTFARFLRAVLRQDPDVIMVGEIRDRETAEIAIQSALTGHLVLSTLHTNDAVATLTRLKYMGIDTFLIADAVKLVMAQRLIRRICPDCKKEAQVNDSALRRIGLDPEDVGKIYEGEGCPKCFGSGYRGRTAIYEILPVTESIRKMIVEGVSDMKIREKAIQEGMVTLRKAAVNRLLEGETTMDMVMTVTF